MLCSAFFAFDIDTTRVLTWGRRKLTWGRRVPASPRRHCQLGVRYPKLAILLLVIFMYLLVKASSLYLQMPTRGRVAPKLACVQDIRPCVPELGCTSVIQNEKMYFFILYCVRFALSLHTESKSVLKRIEKIKRQKGQCLYQEHDKHYLK